MSFRCLLKLIYFVATPGSGHYGFSFMQAAVMARQAADRAATSPRLELRMYLEASLEQVDSEDVVAWWGVSKHFYFTVVLAKLTCHYSITPHSILYLLVLHGTIWPSRDHLFLLNVHSPVVA
jgi:hypothetical protein